jgi:hypothetical protein
MRLTAYSALAISMLGVACTTPQATNPTCPCTCPSGSTAASSAPTVPLPNATANAPAPATSGDVATLVAAQKADEYLHTAQKKLAWHDVPGCIADLDAHDRTDPRPEVASTNARSGHGALIRGQCLMRAGQCDAGRTLFRDAYADAQGMNVSPRQLDTVVDSMVGMNCTAPQAPRDRFLVARFTLQDGAWTSTRTVAECTSAYQTIMSLRSTVTPKDDDDALVKDPLSFLFASAPNCLARAGDCAAAYKTYQQVMTEKFGQAQWTKNPQTTRQTFESMTPSCKGK